MEGGSGRNVMRWRGESGRKLVRWRGGRRGERRVEGREWEEGGEVEGREWEKGGEVEGREEGREEGGRRRE